MFKTRICANCGKYFILANNHLYKLNKNGKMKYYCSYTCWKISGGDKGKYYVK